MPVTTIGAVEKLVAMECSAVGKKYAYECVLELRDAGTGGAIVGAQFMVGAQMLSMAGAHRVKPVVVEERGQGQYGFRIALKKYGEWAITMDFSKPERHRVVKNMMFGEAQVSPLGGYVQGHKHKKHSIGVMVHDAYVRATPPGQPNAAAYLVLRNNAMHDIRLVSVKSDVAEVAEPHSHAMDAGMMKMRRVGHIDVPAGGEIVLQPGGLHIMLMGLVKQLKPGEYVSLEFHFDNGQKQSMRVPVKMIAGVSMTSGHDKKKHKRD
ncbi:MAG: copper chaperone PCu(A)C [Arenicellales bacterium]|nr:copper chaperone PCu(A)C [Arenicellales bacterium]